MGRALPWLCWGCCAEGPWTSPIVPQTLPLTVPPSPIAPDTAAPPDPIMVLFGITVPVVQQLINTGQDIWEDPTWRTPRDGGVGAGWAASAAHAQTDTHTDRHTDPGKGEDSQPHICKAPTATAHTQRKPQDHPHPPRTKGHPESRDTPTTTPALPQGQGSPSLQTHTLHWVQTNPPGPLPGWLWGPAGTPNLPPTGGLQPHTPTPAPHYLLPPPCPLPIAWLPAPCLPHCPCVGDAPPNPASPSLAGSRGTPPETTLLQGEVTQVTG